jgi:hypothetical protein
MSKPKWTGKVGTYAGRDPGLSLTEIVDVAPTKGEIR